MAHEVIFSPEARADLENLYLYIAERSGDVTALSYVERIEAHCSSFSHFPERGMRRDDLMLGLRIVGFERRVSIAFHLEPERVVFDRILYAGRDIDAALDRDA